VTSREFVLAGATVRERESKSGYVLCESERVRERESERARERESERAREQESERARERESQSHSLDQYVHMNEKEHILITYSQVRSQRPH